jgi:hypothetical protein
MLSLFTVANTRLLRPGRFHPLLRTLSSSSSTKPGLRTTKERDKLNYNTTVSFDEHPDSEHVNYPLVSAEDLEQNRQPPTCVKMLVRDFIEDSLYNPHYGYFPQQATIVTSAEDSFDFSTLKDSNEFQEELGKRYAQYSQGKMDGPGRQLWHTPTELFKVGLVTFSSVNAD